MAEYIEREALLKKLAERDLCLCVSESDIKDIPAADVAPVVYGKISCVKFRHIADWFGECSLCGKSVYFESNYCPHCGAKMDKEATNGD